MTTGQILIGIGLALAAGLISNRLIRLVHLPNVTGYLIVGILLGPYLVGIINPALGGVLNKELIHGLGVLVDLALGFIAFSIGSEFKLSSIKKLGKKVIKYKKSIDARDQLCYINEARLILGLFFMLKISK